MFLLSFKEVTVLLTHFVLLFLTNSGRSCLCSNKALKNSRNLFQCLLRKIFVNGTDETER